VLRHKLAAVLAAAASGKLVDASLDEAGLKVAPIRREERERAKALSRRLYALMPRITSHRVHSRYTGMRGILCSRVR
jgi:hypothetical protein